MPSCSSLAVFMSTVCRAASTRDHSGSGAVARFLALRIFFILARFKLVPIYGTPLGGVCEGEVGTKLTFFFSVDSVFLKRGAVNLHQSL